MSRCSLSTTLRLVLLASVITSPMAMAQSSVTLYGIMSTGIAYVDNAGGHSAVQMLPGMLQTNRWGLKGDEDLGGGLHSIFVLENGFASTTGAFQQGGRMFGRQAYVGLSSNDYGTLTFGRQYDASFDYLDLPIAATNSGGMATHIGDNDNSFGSYRINNSIKYRTKTWNGFSGMAQYGFSNGAGEFNVNRAFGAAVAYNSGPVSVALVYTDLRYPGGTYNASGAVAEDYTAASFLLFHTSPLNSAVGVREQRVFGGGGTWQIDKWRLGAVVTHTRFDYADGTYLGLTNYDVSAAYQVTPFLRLSGGAVYTQGAYGGGYSGHPSWTNLQIAADYALSKSTDLYFYFVQGYSHEAKADNYVFTPSTNGEQRIVVAGIRHKF